MNRQTSRPVSVPTVDELHPPRKNDILHSSDGHHWEGVGVRAFCIEALDEFATMPALDCDVVTLQLHGAIYLEQRLDGRDGHGMSYPGDLCMLPKRASVTWRWDRSVTALHIYLMPSLMQQVADEICQIDPAHIELQDRFNIRDPLIHQIGLALLAEVQTGGLAGALFAESLAHTLSVHLLRAHSSLSSTRPLLTSGLTSQQLGRAKDYINDRLAHQLSLRELAATVDLSPTYFARQFKQSTGVAPHQYVVQCRVERAKTLLAEGTMTIADIAVHVGFADHSHLTRHVTRAFGVSPKTILQQGKNIQKAHKNLQDS